MSMAMPEGCRCKKSKRCTGMLTTRRSMIHGRLRPEIPVQIFGPEAGHVRLVYGVQSLPVGAPLIVECIFEIEPARHVLSCKSTNTPSAGLVDTPAFA